MEIVLIFPTNYTFDNWPDWFSFGLARRNFRRRKRVRVIFSLPCRALLSRPTMNAVCTHGAADRRVSTVIGTSNRPGRAQRVGAEAAGRAAPGLHRITA